ncbi:MAG: helix-turn-helix domain-containing protein [Bdellovibrionota bacterium]
MSANISTYLAKNVAELRESKNLTQAQLAKLAGLPRSTVTHIESGAANPSLSNLLAVASALQVNVEEILSKPRRALEHIRAEDIPLQLKAHGKVKIYKLLPDKVRGLNIDLMELNTNSHMPGHPHLRGTKEYLYVIEGEITVFVNGIASVVRKGDVLAFEGDQAHGYKNTGDKKARGLSVVVPLLG